MNSDTGNIENLSEKELLSLINRDKLPIHIAIIMDGNGRWAKKRNLPRLFGHREGMKTVKKVVRICNDLNVKVLSLFAFSTENWFRPKDEISGLMKLLVEFLRKEIKELHEENVNIRTMGRIYELPIEVQKEISSALELTKNNQGLILNVALNYSGRADIIDGIKNWIRINKNNLSETEETLNEKNFAECLYSNKLPDPDLLIRTSGEFRISNFMLWQIAYSEVWITKVLWPDFKREDLLKGIINFQNRERRFGGVI
ncbi:MAG: isoprenyl transferase [bacterium]|nr:isoprenyl transferase [bacterium]